ncbi:MAG: cytochrome c maturation protein CcmE [Alphaproteobacteria bacterium]|nr:cytochrome c maturation protein CcmE [Alphaproteobacteria bacterium]
MTRKRRRLYVVVAAMLCLGVATALMLAAFRENIVFFRSPSDIAAKPLPENQRFRLGGLVEEKSVRKLDGGTVTAFRVTDTVKAIEVTYKGILPDLFREGQGVIAEGRLGPDGVFVASEVLARHDESYMPKEVADAIKKSGQWKETPAKPGGAKP